MSCLVASSGEKHIEKQYLYNCFHNNNSIGLVFLQDGEFKIRKAGSNFENFYKFYQNNICPYNYENVIFIQQEKKFLYQNTNPDTCKPFVLSPNVCVFIDGWLIFKDKLPKIQNNQKSEIQIFVETVLRPIAQIDDTIFKSKPFVDLLFKIIGNTTKLLFFYKNSGNFIYNMSNGYVENDNHVWYSNSDYKYEFHNYSKPKQTFHYPARQETTLKNKPAELKHFSELSNSEIEEIEKEIEKNNEDDIAFLFDGSGTFHPFFDEDF